METGTVKIKDIYTTLSKGVSFRATDSAMIEKNGYIPLLRANNIKNMELNFDELMFIKKQLVKPEQLLRKGDIVFVTSSGSRHLVGKSALVSETEDSITIGAFNSLLRFSENIDPRYIFYVFNSPLFKSHIMGSLAGANINNIRKEHILDFQLPIPIVGGKPNLVVQQKIADRLDSIFSEIKKILKTNEQQKSFSIKVKDSLIRSVLKAEAFSEELVISELLTQVSEQVQPQKMDEVIYIGLEHINSFDRSINNFGSSRQVKSAKWKFKKGDILYGKLRPYLNKCIVADRDGICSTDILVLRPNKSVSARYVAYQMSTQDFVQFATGTMSGMNLPRTTWSKLSDYSIQMPVDESGLIEFSKQEKIADSLDKSFSLLEKLGKDLIIQEQLIVRLEASVLNREFNELVVSSSAVLSPIQITTSPIQQAISLILRRFQRGEMVIAKVLYLGQSVFKVPLGIRFTQQAFGPYSSEIKTSVKDGLSSRKNLFTKKGSGGKEVLALGSSSDTILNHLDGSIKRQMNDYLDQMMPHFFSSDSRSIELLATICKIIEDEKISDDTVIRQKLQEWKPNRFQDSETYRTISFIKKNKWDQKILQV